MLTWDASGDFLEVVDTLEEITWKDGCGGEEVTLNAWRFSERSIASPEGSSSFTVFESTWQLQPVAGVESPAVGDRLVESDGICWVITEVKRLRGKTRFSCDARRIVIRRDMSEWIDLQEAQWQAGSPPTIQGWTTVGLPLRGCVELVGSVVDSEDPSSTNQTYRITLSEPVSATGNHRFRTHAGNTYRVETEVTQPVGPLTWSYNAMLES